MNSDDFLLRLSTGLAFPVGGNESTVSLQSRLSESLADREADASNAAVPVITTSELGHVWDRLQGISRRIDEGYRAREAAWVDIEQLQLDRLIAVLDVAAIWLLLFADIARADGCGEVADGEISEAMAFDAAFVRDHMVQIKRVAEYAENWLTGVAERTGAGGVAVLHPG